MKLNHGVVYPCDLRSASPPSGSPMAVFPILNFLTRSEEDEYADDLSPLPRAGRTKAHLVKPSKEFASGGPGPDPHTAEEGFWMYP